MKCHCHYVFLLRFVFTIVISFLLHAMLPLLANKDEYCRQFIGYETHHISCVFAQNAVMM